MFEDLISWMVWVKSGAIPGKPLGPEFKQACLEQLPPKLRLQGAVEIEQYDLENQRAGK
jgi:hypothetical protein